MPVAAGRRLRRLSLAALGSAFVLALAGATLSWMAGTRLVSSTPHAVPLPGDFRAQAVSFPLSDDGNVKRSVHGWFVPGAGKGAILLLHGIRADRRQMLDRARFLSASGYAVLLIDLPGQGASRAPAITFGLKEADGVAAALGWLKGQAPGQPLGLVGVSLGAASFMLCKTCPRVDAVVLESMYPTIEEAVEDRLRMRAGIFAAPLSKLLLWQLPLRLDIEPAQLRPIDAMAGLRMPLLVAAGERDMHTTIAETRRIFAAAPQPKTLWEVQGAAHVDLHRFAPREYEDRIGRFFADSFKGRMTAAHRE